MLYNNSWQTKIFADSFLFFYSLTKTKMRKKVKGMLWRVAGMASAITAGLVLVGVGALFFQASMQDMGQYGQANVGADFGEVGDTTWEQNAQGHWVADANANPNSQKGDMSKFMVLGDSISFGYMVGYTDESTGQPLGAVDPSLVTKAWPKLVADQAGVEMELAFYSNTPNNLAVPGYALGDMATNYSTLLSKNQLTALVMGGYNYFFGDKTPVDYVLASGASTVGVMIGNNDVLGAATRGNLALKTPVSYFEYMYTDLVAKLAADGTRSVVVSTIPDVAAIPFLVPAEEFAANVGVPLAYLPTLNEDGTPYALASTDYVSLAGYGVLGAGAPLTKCSNTTYTCNGQVLTQGEVDQISAHAAAFNDVIRNLADQYSNVAVMDFDGLFSDIKEKGLVLQGSRYTLDYFGGLVSADGVHPTMLGHGVLANEMIKTLNTNFATGINPIVLHTIAADEQLAGAALTPPVSIRSNNFDKADKILNGELVQ